MQYFINWADGLFNGKLAHTYLEEKERPTRSFRRRPFTLEEAISLGPNETVAFLNVNDGSALFEPCRTGDLDSVQALVAAMRNCDDYVTERCLLHQALEHACANGRMNVVQYLLTLEGRQRVCVTYMSFLGACSNNHVALVRLLLRQNGITAYLYHEDSKMGFDIVHWVRSEKCVQDWVAEGLEKARRKKADDVVELLSKLKP